MLGFYVCILLEGIRNDLNRCKLNNCLGARVRGRRAVLLSFLLCCHIVLAILRVVRKEVVVRKCSILQCYCSFWSQSISRSVRNQRSCSRNLTSPFLLPTGQNSSSYTSLWYPSFPKYLWVCAYKDEEQVHQWGIRDHKNQAQPN